MLSLSTAAGNKIFIIFLKTRVKIIANNNNARDVGARLYVVSILAWEMLLGIFSCGIFLAVAHFKKGRAWLSSSQLVELRFLKSFGIF